MCTPSTHRVTTPDGVAIEATVHGQGPPLVFLHGVMGDGATDWRALLPHLTDRFTCHLPSMRGRGLSGEHSDLDLGRVIDDFLTYAGSLGEAVRLVGWSGGANWALATAARSSAATAVAAIEPVANGLMDERERAALASAVAAAGELVEEGDLAAAMRAFAAYPFSESDTAAATDAGYFEATKRYAPHMVELFQRFARRQGPAPDDPSVLGAIRAPVLVLHGTDTKPFMTTSAQHVVANVPDARLQAIDGAGHASPLTHPEVLSEALRGFFAAAGT